MARTSSTSNPTKLIDIDRQRVTIDVTAGDDGKYAALSRCDLTGYDLAPDLKLVLIARAGATFCRLELGTVGAWDKSPKRLVQLDPRGFLRFRVLIHADGDPRLVASAENLAARDLALSDSILSMEPADLGEVVWNLTWNGDEPILQFNQDLFPSAKGATAYPPFNAFVLPEVVRQIAAKIAADPDRLDDESDPLHVWGDFLDALGVGEPPDEDDADAAQWVGSVTEAFARRARFATDLKRVLHHVD